MGRRGLGLPEAWRGVGGWGGVLISGIGGRGSLGFSNQYARYQNNNNEDIVTQDVILTREAALNMKSLNILINIYIYTAVLKRQCRKKN